MKFFMVGIIWGGGLSRNQKNWSFSMSLARHCAHCESEGWHDVILFFDKFYISVECVVTVTVMSHKLQCFVPLKFSINDSLIPINNLLGKKKTKITKVVTFMGLHLKKRKKTTFLIRWVKEVLHLD